MTQKERKTIRIDPAIHATIKARAKAEGRKIEVMVERLLKTGLRMTAEEKE